MTHRQLWIAAAWSFVTALAAALAGLGACIWSGGKLWSMPIVMLAVGVAGLTPIFRYCARANREAGIGEPSPRSFREASVLLYLALFAITVGLEWAVYGITKSRIAEWAVAFALVVPVGIAVVRFGYALQPPPKPQELPALRLSTFLQRSPCCTYTAMDSVC